LGKDFHLYSHKIGTECCRDRSEIIEAIKCKSWN